SISARHPARMALAAGAVRIAAEARRRGFPDPLAGGTISLRRSLAVTGEARQQFVATLNAQALRQFYFQLYVRLPLPGPLKYALRRAAIALGLKPLYSAWLDMLEAIVNFRCSTPPQRRER